MEIGCIGAAFEAKFADSDASPGSFEGYGAVFGNIDSHGDIIEPGAFAKSLLDRQREGRGLPPMYKMHGGKIFPGNRHEPVGVWDAMSEDAAGLHVKGRLIGLDTDQGKWNYAQLKEGGLKGLSIGFSVPAYGARSGSGKAGEPKRFLKALNLKEVSLVDDPSNALSQVYRMKSRAEDGEDFADEIKTIREFEDFLRDVGGYSHAAAKAIAAGGFKAQLDPRDEDRESVVAAIIADAANRIRGK
ncbi:HK97 family phage prohead protease [Mesorhizobium sp. M6A.T.Ce.TU.016.01.1.1]|uniref:HK97 family phage prohead protease n=1 Tax=Mesorhizobium sp. M6A.T.Ce.TU.016.01.1.1 TaxID=2496783 RepID=UPI000FCA7825|nr:HK97 family phage prohead protease [Mesorhizobium sp. M6A.T.Ce.TU.016.01.1.1]RUU29753.1 HK97 family phage prohead protease [Mesorhizobium sp. M6A.T.Ce.TU.016.01.1.1]